MQWRTFDLALGGGGLKINHYKFSLYSYIFPNYKILFVNLYFYDDNEWYEYDEYSKVKKTIQNTS